MKGSLDVLLSRIEALGVFKILSTLLYSAGLWYRATAGFMALEAEFSYEAVRQWRNRLERTIPKPQR